MTVNANELRIGNKVNLCFHHKPGWFVANVTEIRSGNTIESDSKDQIEGKRYYYEAVPLTEEWLLKFGFHKYADGKYLIGRHDFSYHLTYRNLN